MLPRRIPGIDHLPGRFLSYVQSRDGCWEWDGQKKATGYGYFCFNGKKYFAHRFSYHLFKGNVPDGHCVMHKCDNPSCVNPAHLTTGTQKDNMRDMARKGRSGAAKGELSRFATLTEDDARAILASDAPGTHLARMYGVTKGAIYAIRKRKTWKHLHATPTA